MTKLRRLALVATYMAAPIIFVIVETAGLSRH